MGSFAFHAIAKLASGTVHLDLNFSELAVPIFGIRDVSKHVVSRAIGPAGTDSAGYVVIILEE
jgi:hypothetical protein